MPRYLSTTGQATWAASAAGASTHHASCPLQLGSAGSSTLVVGCDAHAAEVKKKEDTVRQARGREHMSLQIVAATIRGGREDARRLIRPSH